MDDLSGKKLSNCKLCEGDRGRNPHFSAFSARFAVNYYISSKYPIGQFSMIQLNMPDISRHRLIEETIRPGLIQLNGSVFCPKIFRHPVVLVYSEQKKFQ